MSRPENKKNRKRKEEKTGRWNDGKPDDQKMRRREDKKTRKQEDKKTNR